MIRKSGIGYVSLALMLQLAVPPATGEENPVPFHYSDEWSVVSAPPPAGPYRAVNIDPRVPGAGGITVMPMPVPVQQAEMAATPATEQVQTTEGVAVEAAGSIPAEDQARSAALQADTRMEEAATGLPEDVMLQSPAAGIPARYTETVAPAEAAARGMQQESGARQPSPGYYGRMMTPRPAFVRPAPAQYPYQAGYPAYRSMPPYGYYSAPARSREPEVPPPPLYDQYEGYGYRR